MLVYASILTVPDHETVGLFSMVLQEIFLTERERERERLHNEEYNTVVSE